MSGRSHPFDCADLSCEACGDEAVRRFEAALASPKNRILWNERGGCIDEIVVHNATVHIEQMADTCWWIGIDLPDGTYWAGNFHTRRAPMQFTEQESDIAWDDDDAHREPA